MRKKRKVFDKVMKMKGLAESDSESESTADWVKKSREAEEERMRAEERVGLFIHLYSARL